MNPNKSKEGKYTRRGSVAIMDKNYKSLLITACRPCNYNSVGRAHSTLSVSGIDYYMNLPVNGPSPAISTVTLTPGRIRNIDQDMETLRMSRQDNPFLQVSNLQQFCNVVKFIY